MTPEIFLPFELRAVYSNTGIYQIREPLRLGDKQLLSICIAGKHLEINILALNAIASIEAYPAASYVKCVPRLNPLRCAMGNLTGLVITVQMSRILPATTVRVPVITGTLNISSFRLKK